MFQFINWANCVVFKIEHIFAWHLIESNFTFPISVQFLMKMANFFSKKLNTNGSQTKVKTVTSLGMGKGLQFGKSMGSQTKYKY